MVGIVAFRSEHIKKKTLVKSLKKVLTFQSHVAVPPRVSNCTMMLVVPYWAEFCPESSE